MDTLKSQVIINELLCFLANKRVIMSTDDMVELCLNSFSDTDISEAKKILKVACESTGVSIERFKKRQGPNKERKNLEDIVAMLTLLDAVQEMPIFAATDLQKLPPIGFDTLDVSNLLFRIQQLENDVTNLKTSADRSSERTMMEANNR